jgi:hypothetical protein
MTILSEESRAEIGSRRQPETDGTPPARTAANFFGPEADERMSKREALGLIVGVSLSVWAVGLALFVVSL